jgi:LysR family transcriptional regulator, hydrogen peroxide-inducible genes activator|tara:strand:+ start:22739 stop:23623 length:885 start_codon:yes stop_codon:yes gene_type:complete
MNIQQLAYIVAVDRFKSFSKAAFYCNVTQATLSAMVKKLEIELDIVIFDRKTTPIITTQNGKEIIEKAQLVVAHADALLASSKALLQKVAGRVRIGIIPTIASSLLPIILKPLLVKFPELFLEIHELTTTTLIQHLKEGKMDIAILSTPISAPEIESNLLYLEDLVVYGHLSNDAKTIDSKDLKNEQVFLLQKGHCLRDQVIELCGLNKSNNFSKNFLFESNTFDTLINLVDQFQGLTVLPKLYTQQMSPERQSKLIELIGGSLQREVSLAFYRPFAKHKINQVLTAEIQRLLS